MFLLVVITGIYGNQNPGQNFSTIITWTVWWSGIIFLILFLGASWCLICPWSAVADWLERLSFWRTKEGISLGYKWPKELQNRHLATGFFIIVTWFELGTFITYSPLRTAYLAFFMLFLIAVTALVFEKKAFCRYVCFVGGIVGMYSNLAPVEVRSKESDVCDRCKTKDCVKGNDKGYGCPIYEYPGGMDNNSNCILCTECIKTCPHDNMTVNIRPFLTDISKGYKARYDEALLILTLLALTFYHGFTMLPLWFEWAIRTMENDYVLYMSVFTFLEIGIIIIAGVIHLAASYIAKSISGDGGVNLKDIFVNYSYAFLPVALFYHLAHNTAHLNLEGLGILPVISVPFGWGQDIFGTGNWKIPMLFGMRSMEGLQLILIIIGLVASIYLSYRITLRLFQNRKNAMKIMAPIVMVITGYSLLSAVILLRPMAMRLESFCVGF